MHRNRNLEDVSLRVAEVAEGIYEPNEGKGSGWRNTKT